MRIVRDAAALAAAVSAWRAAGERVALVPTMGYLHEGHLALVARGRELAQRVVATIFVNPTQFAPHEDLGRYPRDEEGDIAKLEGAGCDLLFAPPVEVMYPPGFATRIVMSGPAEGLEGTHRPQMFSGVALVCSRLFGLSRADVAVFGEKDWQQVMVIRRVVEDLAIPIAIETVPTVRAADGLALSSRNAYLDAEARQKAVELYRVLTHAAERLKAGATATEACGEAETRLREAGFRQVDYVALRSELDFSQMEKRIGPARALGAAWLGQVRLIDNLVI
ncbi:pantoate--beta-alanine ligase [Roseococcus sp. SYP-B2431]|uniref:pantoate--beta-alanine ligase n=1 Tax=Roseococcus sp. SYP-B2431 TaxID=2496640 RepID=UPI00103FA199|nr:pantoate--beta-alanine ligase [Roseococcus sp. SYP-B2431]TCH96983.1 pantoate--beta-alanine ligase [Roseococcus sp. SYP-B2431]